MLTGVPSSRSGSFTRDGLGGAQGLSITQKVLREFAGLHHELTEVAGVGVSLWQHGAQHATPDAVFPNNWFSTHAAGEGGGAVRENTLVLYPMKCENRCGTAPSSPLTASLPLLHRRWRGALCKNLGTLPLRIGTEAWRQS